MITKSLEDNQIKATKSTRFPSIELAYAIKVTEEARKFGRRVKNSHIAGDSSIVSGAFKQKKASLGYYGLIKGRDDDFEISDLAESIINPIADEERKDAVKQAFLSPEVFRRLFESIEKGKAIRLDILGNLVIREYGIKPSSKNDFLNTFVRAGRYAELIEYGKDKSEITALPLRNSTINLEGEKNILDAALVSAPNEAVNEDTQTVELILSNGKAKIVVPRSLSENDAKKLKMQIDILADLIN